MSLTNKPNAEEIDVRLVDQEKINEFGKLNNRLLELRADIVQYKQDIEKLDDATAELMMATGGTVMLFMGESFVETSEEYANEYAERKQKELQDRIDELTNEEAGIVKRQELLKKELYSRFGDNINLEN